MSKKIALACEWLTENGGAERVIELCHDMYPDAPIYTSQYRKKRTKWLKNADVRAGELNILPSFLRKFIAPLRQKYFMNLDLSDYDTVISITGSDAKLIKTGNHICYCHVPTQYYWGKYNDYIKNPGFGALNPIARFYLKKSIKKLRKNDKQSIKNIKTFITISEYAKKEIKKYYKREAKVIYPPVNVEFFAQAVENYKTKNTKSQIKKAYNKTIKKQKSQENKTEHIFFTGVNDVKNLDILIELVAKYPSGFYVNYSRQVNWKRLDLAVKTCIKMQLPLVLIGSGPENKKLKRLARKNKKLITFYDSLPQTDLRAILQLSKAFIFPSCEPFGIAPVEALAAGVPVIAFKKGGALDYIKDGKNGVFFSSQTEKSLERALKKFEKMDKRRIIFNKTKVSKTAEKFSKKNFICNLEKVINEKD